MKSNQRNTSLKNSWTLLQSSSNEIIQSTISLYHLKRNFCHPKACSKGSTIVKQLFKKNPRRKSKI